MTYRNLIASHRRTTVFPCTNVHVCEGCGERFTWRPEHELCPVCGDQTHQKITMKTSRAVASRDDV